MLQVFTSHDPQWESEGRDQEPFNLPRQGTQDAVVTAVAAANSNTIFVNSTGTPVAMPWLQGVWAVIQAWFPGQECDNSIADVLTGVVNPEGRLPVSFPRRIENSPAYDNFPGEKLDGQLKVEYAEDLFVPYRHYDLVLNDRPNFAFGYGLSYTTFFYGDSKVIPSIKSHDRSIAEIKVSNTGSKPGGTVIQLYFGRKAPAAEHPVKSLIAFQKIRLADGQLWDI